MSITGRVKFAYPVYESYTITSGNIKGLLQDEYKRFLKLYKQHLKNKNSPLYKNLLIKTQNSFETAIKTNKVNVLITRCSPVLFTISSLEQNTDYLFEILIKGNNIKFNNQEYLQEPIREMFKKLEKYKFLIKSKDKTFNQFSKDLSSKVYFI